jgi:hypothetical protein
LGLLVCLLPIVWSQWRTRLDLADYTHKHDCCKHDGWDACDVNGDVDLSNVSMLESLFGKTIADALKSESHLSLLKLDLAMTSTERLYVSLDMASRVEHPSIWPTWLTGWSFEFQRNSEAARACGRTGL